MRHNQNRYKVMKWNVYNYNINTKRIEIFNIFEHGAFKKYIKIASQKCKTKDDFLDQLRRELFYYFCSKSEYEVIISPWVGGDREKDSIKVDIYSQVMNNWEVFSNYVWDNKNTL